MTAVDRTPKPCHHPRAEHRHGTYACYVLDTCRCLPCAGANSTYERDRKKRNAYGRSNLVDAQPVREHVAALMAAGVGLKRTVELSGVPQGALWKLMYGKRRPNGDAAPSRRVTKATAERILALDPANPALLADGAPIPSVGASRRLQALSCLGWSISRLSTESGIDRQVLDKALRGEGITAGHVRAIAALYEQIWDRPPPEAHHRERIAAARARNRARAAGWAPPLAWDDDSIDDPAAAADSGDVEDQVDDVAVERAANGDRTVALNPAEVAAAVATCNARGLTDWQTGALLGITDRTVLRIRHGKTTRPQARPGRTRAA